MCCLVEAQGSAYFSSNMLSGRQSSVSPQCCIDSQSLVAKGLNPDTRLLHFFSCKRWGRWSLSPRITFCALFPCPWPTWKGEGLKNVFCDSAEHTSETSWLCPQLTATLPLPLSFLQHFNAMQPKVPALNCIQNWWNHFLMMWICQWKCSHCEWLFK